MQAGTVQAATVQAGTVQAATVPLAQRARSPAPAAGPSAPHQAAATPVVPAAPAPINPDSVPPIPTSDAPSGLLSRFIAGIVRHRFVFIASPLAAIAVALVAWLMFRPAETTTTAVEVVTPQASAEIARSDAPAAAATPTIERTGQLAEPAAADEPASPVVAENQPAAADNAPAEEGPVKAAATPDSATTPDSAKPEAADVADESSPAAVAGATVGAAPVANERKLQPPVVGHLSQPVAPFAATPPGNALPKVTTDQVPPSATAPADDRGPADLLVAQESMPPVDVAARLADPLPGLQFKRVSLADFCDFLSRLSTVPITLDVDALAVAGVRVGDAVAISSQDTTVGDALTDVLSKRGLMYLVEGQQVIVTSPERKAAGLVTVTYDVRDLWRPEAASEVDRLAAMVSTLRCSAPWQDHGGKGRENGRRRALDRSSRIRSLSTPSSCSSTSCARRTA